MIPIRGTKILHIITGLGNGGAEAVLYRLCCFDNQNIHTVISLTDQGKYGALLKQAGIDVYSLDMPNGRLSIQGLHKLWRTLRSIKPVVVQTWMYHADLVGGVVAWIAGVRVICWGIRNSDVHPVKTKRSTHWVVHACALLGRWLPVRIVCCAQTALKVHSQLGYPGEKCVVIPNGYDLELFQPSLVGRERLRREWGIYEQMPLLGMVARFDPQKDHQNLIKALGILKSNAVVFRCVLIGEGVTKDCIELTSLIDQYNLTDEVLLLGARNDIPDVMNALDINILSSAYGEAFPNVLAEAMACGTPCVTTDVGDAAFIVAHTGWIVSKQDDEALSQALLESLLYLKNRLEWEARQRACRDSIVENFSIQKTVLSYQKVWSECISSMETSKRLA